MLMSPALFWQNRYVFFLRANHNLTANIFDRIAGRRNKNMLLIDFFEPKTAK